MSNIDKYKAIKNLLADFPDIKLAILYGSFQKNNENYKSDVDLAVAADKILDSEIKMRLIEKLSSVTGRPIDLVDLQSTHGTLLKNILTEGSIIYRIDNTLYANILKRMLFNDADMMPYYYRTIKEQRERWLNK